MGEIMIKLRAFAIVSGVALTVAACGGNKEPEAVNTTTTEMLSTETTLDGTTNDATSLDAAAGMDNEVAAATNEAAANTATAQ